MKQEMKKKIIPFILLISIIVIIFLGSICLVFILSNQEYYIYEKNIDIPIFVYHDIVDKMTGEEFMQTTKESFENQIVGLQKIGYEFIRYDDLIHYKKGEKKLKEKSILLTFDDGYEGNYYVMYPIIQKYQIPVAINIVDNNIGKPGILTWNQIKEMSDSGLVDFYTHSRYHKYSDMVSTEQYIFDIQYAHEHIEKQLGKSISKVFTYPYGVKQKEKIEALTQAGFIQNLTDNRINQSETLDLSRLHREYPLNDSVPIILFKTIYRSIRYH